MLALSKKNLWFFIALAILLTAATLAVIHAANPLLWHQLLVQSPVPGIQSGFH